MAFQKYEIGSQEWVLIGDNVSAITFQNISQYPVYINFNTSSAVPTDDFGLVYSPATLQGELKRPLTDLTFLANPTHVFAKAVSASANIIVEV